MPRWRALQGEFYQYVLGAVYHCDGLWGEATFDLYPRELPEGWGYLVAAGLGPALDQVEGLCFGEDEILSMKRDPIFAGGGPGFLDHLRRFRFDGDIDAVPEGTPVFPGEPILRVTGTLLACTLLETRLIQVVAASCAVATRAARIVEAAEGRGVYDFGSRRGAGPEAALLAARAAYLGGCSATTNALAHALLGIPAMGTMSETFLAAYGDDRAALEAFRLHFPGLGYFALPADDPAAGVAQLAPLRGAVQGVRIDSADLGRVAREVREALDARGMQATRIVASGQLDEHRVAALVQAGAPIDRFAVGRALAAAGVPGLHLAFRIAEVNRGRGPEPVTRAGSAAFPGRKQIARAADRDVLCLESETPSLDLRGASLLLRPVMRRGARTGAEPSLADARAERARAVARLPAGLRRLVRPDAWPVVPSDAVAALASA